ncbi:Diphthamide biosynthesis protein 3 [Lachnellula arida]|uniref:Diphthamide biosynthesis protein 3 n=1 Tax=Lachnellula arida TaxID=1316785 RepID=A0A8T9B631_9HELO|nr:Diphthamide biosynthesis protein 3 [Lachnellula arida]
MAENIYDEIEIEDMTYDPTLEIYHYPCPCGDRFEIAIADLRDQEDIAVCPSCSLMIRVIFEVISGQTGSLLFTRSGSGLGLLLTRPSNQDDLPKPLGAVEEKNTVGGENEQLPVAAA